MDSILSITSDILLRLNVDPTFSFLGNSLSEYATALVVLILLLVVFKIAQFSILHWLKHVAEKTATNLDDTFIRIVRSLRPQFYTFVAFYVAIQTLTLTEVASRVVDVILIIWVTYQVIIAVQILINYFIRERLVKEGDAMAQSALQVLGRIAKGVLWAIGIILVLDNLGVNVSSLIAGLGIGGVAIAFALQNILSDLFASFAIYFDKPFTVGDLIAVGEDVGTVEKIGIKTTRLRDIRGEELVISNRELTSARIQNYKKMEERRVVFSFGVLYETPLEQVRSIPDMVRDVLNSVEKTRFDIAYFKSFDDSALTFEVVYYVLTADYNEYLAIQQDINLGIMEKFKEAKIEFAYPTRTVHLSKA